MRLEPNHREVFAGHSSLGDDFALIAEAIFDAFRGLRPSPPLDSRRSALSRCGGGN